MRLVFRHIVLAFTVAALLVGGCSRQAVPVTVPDEDDYIEFGTGSILLEQETKGVAALDARTRFALNDLIKVYGWHYRGDAPLVFDGQEVQLTAKHDAPEKDEWTYSPKQRWAWTNDDYYDFLAVPEGVTATHSNETPFTLSVHYDPTVIQYDLLMAGKRHKISDSNPGREVELNFNHMLCAVKVRFHKASGGEQFIVTAYHFTDLIANGDIMGYWNDDEERRRFDSRIANAQRLQTEQFGIDRTLAEPWLNDANFLKTLSDEYDPGFYDLLLPQDLDGDGAPSLVVKFMDHVDDDPDDSIVQYHEYEPDPVPLKDIKVAGSEDQFITRWEAGHIYIYDVYILFNGGVLVNVSTSQWEDVPAQTPGLMI